MTAQQATLVALASTLRPEPSDDAARVETLPTAQAFALVETFAGMVAAGDALGAAWELAAFVESFASQAYTAGHTAGYDKGWEEGEGSSTLDGSHVRAMEGRCPVKVRILADETLKLECTALDPTTNTTGRLVVDGHTAKWTAEKVTA